MKKKYYNKYTAINITINYSKLNQYIWASDVNLEKDFNDKEYMK